MAEAELAKGPAPAKSTWWIKPAKGNLMFQGRLACQAAVTARRSAARASSRVESSVGSAELASLMISGISVQP